MNYSEHRFQSPDGLSLYFRDYPGPSDSADVVLCLHGLTRNSKDFHPLASRLMKTHRVLVPDFRGRGQSDWDRDIKNYHPATYVDDCWQMLSGLGINDIHIVGTSLGGLMAMFMAWQQEPRLKSVVLNDVGPEIPPEAVSRLLEYTGRNPACENWEGASQQAKQNYKLAYPDADEAFWLDWAQRSYRHSAGGEIIADMDPGIGEALRAGPGQVSPRAVPNDTWDAFSAMTMPVLLLHGLLSDILTPDIVRKMQQRKPDIQYLAVEQRGHTPTLDEPVVVEAIGEFLAQE